MVNCKFYRQNHHSRCLLIYSLIIYSKINSGTTQYATIQRLIKSYFVSLQALLLSVASDSGIPALAVTESAKLIPWIVGNRKVARGWMKLLLGLYNSAADEVRFAAYKALRSLAVAGDHSLRESVIKVCLPNDVVWNVLTNFNCQI